MLQRVLIVGLGSIGRRHLRMLHELLPGAELAALRHRPPVDAVNGAADHVFFDLNEAISFRPQAAIIANPAPFHVTVAHPLARAGTHLFIEKPLSSSVAGVAELLHECQDRKLVLQTGYNLRFLPSLRHFRQLLAEGAIGRVLSVRADVGQYLPSWRPKSDYRESVTARAALGGGALLELSHELDYLRWLFGPVQWVNAIQRRMSDLEIDVEDTVYLLLGLGPREEEPVVASLCMDLVRHDTTRMCTVIGTEGTLRWDAVASTVSLFEKSSKSWREVYADAPARDASYTAQLSAFVHCIDAGIPAEPSGADGLAVLYVIDAARKSAESGCVVYLDEAPPA